MCMRVLASVPLLCLPPIIFSTAVTAKVQRAISQTRSDLMATCAIEYGKALLHVDDRVINKLTDFTQDELEHLGQSVTEGKGGGVVWRLIHFCAVTPACNYIVPPIFPALGVRRPSFSFLQLVLCNSVAICMEFPGRD